MTEQTEGGGGMRASGSNPPGYSRPPSFSRPTSVRLGEFPSYLLLMSVFVALPSYYGCSLAANEKDAYLPPHDAA